MTCSVNSYSTWTWILLFFTPLILTKQQAVTVLIVCVFTPARFEHSKQFISAHPSFHSEYLLSCLAASATYNSANMAYHRKTKQYKVTWSSAQHHTLLQDFLRITTGLQPSIYSYRLNPIFNLNQCSISHYVWDMLNTFISQSKLWLSLFCH